MRIAALFVALSCLFLFSCARNVPETENVSETKTSARTTEAPVTEPPKTEKPPVIDDFTTSIHVLGVSLDFGDSADVVRAKLGEPTEALREGDYLSYVYAADYKRFTVIQLDDFGLWGFFTFDADAVFACGSVSLTQEDMNGFLSDSIGNDRPLEAELGDFGITGFVDYVGSGEAYAMWVSLQDCEYFYNENPHITQNFFGQEKLCFHLTNALRAMHNLRALRYCETASAVSRSFSEYLTAHEFDHDGKLWNRLTAAGLRVKACAENISKGYFNVFYVADAYYNSPSHRNAILSASYTSLGTGFARSGAVVCGAQSFYS